MVLGLLIVMWVIVLTPALLKGRLARRGGVDSVKSFRHQINVIRRTAPATIVPANRRPSRVAEAGASGVVTPIRPVGEAAYFAGGPPMGRRTAAAPGRPFGNGGPGQPGPRVAGGSRSLGGPAGPVGAPSRTAAMRPGTRTLQRRRQVMAGLLAAVALTFLVGLVPSLRMLWGATALCAVLLVGYVLLLVQMRSRAAEREMKLAFLPHRAEPAMVLHRSAN